MVSLHDSSFRTASINKRFAFSTVDDLYNGPDSSTVLARPDLAGWKMHRGKRALDLTLALLISIIASPLLAIIAIAIKCDSRGPVIFKQARHGQNKVVFTIYKFRSMHITDSTSVRQTTRDDPRVTRVGRILRMTSLDELPQLWNVLRGEMSFVGPRPHAIDHDHAFSTLIGGYESRFIVKPGITGLAQVSGFRGETETIDKIALRVRADLAYISNWSFSLDIKILFLTLLVTWRDPAAY